MKKVIKSAVESSNDKVYRRGGMSVNQYMKRMGMQEDLNGLRCYYRDEVDPDKYPTFVHWVKARRGEQDGSITAASDDDVYAEFDRRMKSNSTFQKLEKLCNLHGYKLYDANNEKYRSGKIVTTVTMRPDESRGDWAQFLDDIIYDYKSNSFKAQTPSYGALTLKEYKLFAQAVNHISLLLEELDELDLSGLYTWESEDM